MNAIDANNPSERHRITFATEKTLAYISVLELTSIFERSLRRAKVPLRYSQGFNPRPRMNFAAPLPVGCGSQADYADIWLEHALQSEVILTALLHQTPQHLSIKDISPIDMEAPTLAEQLVSAEYVAWLHGVEAIELASKVKGVMAAAVISRPRRGRKHRGHNYDLRPLILDLQVIEDENTSWMGLWMHLMARHGATGRPDEVVKTMGLSDCLRRCTRTRLILS